MTLDISESVDKLCVECVDIEQVYECQDLSMSRCATSLWPSPIPGFYQPVENICRCPKVGDCILIIVCSLLVFHVAL